MSRFWARGDGEWRLGVASREWRVATRIGERREAMASGGKWPGGDSERRGKTQAAPQWRRVASGDYGHDVAAMVSRQSRLGTRIFILQSFTSASFSDDL
jgi:hypothetical protein